MREYATNKLSCGRDVLYSNFDGYERVFTQSLCLCCDLCSKLCDCNKCAEKHNNLFSLKSSFSEDVGIIFLSKFLLLTKMLILYYQFTIMVF